MKNKKMLTSNLTRKRKTIWGSLISVGIMGVTAGIVLSITRCSCHNGGGDIPPEPASGTFAEIQTGITIGKMDFSDFQLNCIVNWDTIYFDSGFSLEFYEAGDSGYDLSFFTPPDTQYVFCYEDVYTGNISILYNGTTFSWILADHTLTMSPADTVSSVEGDLTNYVGGMWYNSNAL